MSTLEQMSKNKALLIGINYTGTRNELRGCHNDVKNILSYLKERFAVVHEIKFSSLGDRDVDDDGVAPKSSCCGGAFTSCLPKKTPGLRASPADDSSHAGEETLDVLILTDDQGGRHNPTLENILNGFYWLTHDATADSNLLVTYSGHGSHQRDRSGDEEDGQDESLVPVDFLKVGCLVDDEVRRQLVDPLPEGCNLRMILDCCHSGSGSDLKYCYRDVDVLSNNTQPHTNSRQTETKCNVVSWSGCMDTQTSADAWISGEFAGALTATFLKVLRDPNQDKSYETIYKTLLQDLKKDGYTQRPQLSAGKVIDVTQKFDLF